MMVGISDCFLVGISNT